MQNVNLILEITNEDGEIVEKKKLPKKTVNIFYSIQDYNEINFTDNRLRLLIDKGLFKKREWRIINRIILENRSGPVTEERASYFQELFKNYALKEIEFALDIMMSKGPRDLIEIPDVYNDMPADNWHAQRKNNGLIAHHESKYYDLELKSIDEALDFINERRELGFYYTKTEEGKRGWDFVDKPFKTQVKYQERKHNRNIYYMDFKTWEEITLTLSNF
jgi:hypothetical protein